MEFTHCTPFGHLLLRICPCAMEVARRDLAVWISVTLFICPWHGRLDRHCRGQRHGMAVYAIRVGGWLSELVGQQRLVGLEEALTLFESVSFIGQLLFVAADALVLERNGRGRRISAFPARRAIEPRVALALSRLFGNGRMEREEARENKPCITLNMRSQIHRAKERKKASEKAMHASAPVLLMLWYSNIERFFQ